jgi:hypothetical protein
LEEQESVALKLGEFVRSLDDEAMPADVVEMAKSRVLQHLAVAFRAARLPESKAAWAAVRDRRGSASLVGLPEKVTADDAAYFNGVTGHLTLREAAYFDELAPEVVDSGRVREIRSAVAQLDSTADAGTLMRLVTSG